MAEQIDEIILQLNKLDTIQDHIKNLSTPVIITQKNCDLTRKFEAQDINKLEKQ